MTGLRCLPAHLRSLGLERNPFPQTPDADCYFRTEKLACRFAEILHCVLAGKGFVLLTGEVGTGKSTFLRAVLDQLLAAECSVAFIFNTFLQGHDLLRAINRDFGLPAEGDLAEDLACLNHFLIARHVEGKTSVVIIDDAQNLDNQSLELLRLLSNLETRQHKLLQIVLSGQPELVARLAQPDIRQLASRIVQHAQLGSFDRHECARYVDFRLAHAGNSAGFQVLPAAQQAIYRYTQGNPRRVHLLMDRCLYGVLASGQRVIDAALVELAAQEIGVAPAVARLSVRWRPWLGRLLAGAGIGAMAWAGAAAVGAWWPAAPTVPTVPTVPIVPTVPMVIEQAAASSVPAGTVGAGPCLEALGASRWQQELQAGVAADREAVLRQALAAYGVVLIREPEALPLPRALPEVCRWQSASGRWLLWRPAWPVFDLQPRRRGENVRWLQSRLAAAGLYAAPTDGIVGEQTQAALRAFRVRHGLPDSERADMWTLFFLQYAPSPTLP